MRLTTRIHGYLDYLVAALLVGLPWVAGFGASPAGFVAMGAGAAILLLTLVTNFESGRIPRLEVAAHLWIDGLVGLLLALSPWLLEFDRTAWIPHVAMGGVIILVAFITDTVPERDRRAAGAGR